MSRPPLEVADLIRGAGAAFIERNRQWLSWKHISPATLLSSARLSTAGRQDISSSKAPSDLWLCPKCGGPMMLIERLTAAEIQLRSPPALVTEAA